MFEWEKQYKIFNKTLATKAIFSLMILLAAIIILVVVLAGVYTDKINRTSSGDIVEAKKIGNWDFVDGNYILKSNEILNIDGRKVGTATIRDNKNGNKIVIFATEFYPNEIAVVKGETFNKLLSFYEMEGFYYKEREPKKTGKYGQEIQYYLVGWKFVTGENTGIIGNIDCNLENGKKNSIFLVAINSTSKYDNNRVLSFMDTIKCLDMTNRNDNIKPEDKLDTDKDGLTDLVEKMLFTDPFKADSDEDGTNDGDEIKVGRNPSLHYKWQDEFTAEEFSKIKRDIKFVSIYNYDNLFPEN